MKKQKNIIDYIEYIKDYSFDLVSFNELDSLIMASISYINFENILKKYDSMTIEESATSYFNKYTKSELKRNVFSVQTGIKILNSIYKTKRYKDLVLRKFVRKIEDNKQFQAICIDINKNLSYLSFEGTDDLISGWYEDAAMSYKFPVPSQMEAIKYIKRYINPFSKRKYILGGHSKGGNLALVAAMYGKTLKKSKIESIYMFDAPGLREKEVNSHEFKQIEDKIIRVVTNYTIVGLLFYNTENILIVKSMKKGVMAHNMINWCVEEEAFSYTKLSSFSKKFKENLESWLNNYSDEERQIFVHDLFSLFKRAEIKSLLDLKKQKIKKVLTLIKESKKIDAKTKEILNEFIKLMVDFIKEESSSLISNKFPSLKH